MTVGIEIGCLKDLLDFTDGILVLTRSGRYDWFKAFFEA
jgi:hypothetical protein